MAHDGGSNAQGIDEAVAADAPRWPLHWRRAVLTAVVVLGLTVGAMFLFGGLTPR